MLVNSSMVFLSSLLMVSLIGHGGLDGITLRVEAGEKVGPSQRTRREAFRRPASAHRSCPRHPRGGIYAGLWARQSGGFLGIDNAERKACRSGDRREPAAGTLFKPRSEKDRHRQPSV
ncbi:hypothetical protein ACDY97_08080 [Rhizobium mongolense]|uniref:hypothetical protein n=1 Tax=Rhizobium mongolense TaxID=57676 RepID=UPI003555EAAB